VETPVDFSLEGLETKVRGGGCARAGRPEGVKTIHKGSAKKPKSVRRKTNASAKRGNSGGG